MGATLDSILEVQGILANIQELQCTPANIQGPHPTLFTTDTLLRVRLAILVIPAIRDIKATLDIMVNIQDRVIPTRATRLKDTLVKDILGRVTLVLDIQGRGTLHKDILAKGTLGRDIPGRDILARVILDRGTPDRVTLGLVTQDQVIQEAIQDRVTQGTPVQDILALGTQDTLFRATPVKVIQARAKLANRIQDSHIRGKASLTQASIRVTPANISVRATRVSTQANTPVSTLVTRATR